MKHGTGTRVLVVALAAASMTLAGCASKKYVREGFATQDGKITDLQTQVEDGQRRLSETGERLDGVALDAREAGAIGRQAGARAEEAYGLAKGKLLYTVVLSENAGTFGFNRSELSDATREAIDELAGRLKAENANVFIEVEGHTDSTGEENYNLRLGELRADAVRRYLITEHAIPIHRISIISYGETRPVAGNDSREGRSQNRRVEVRVLS